MAAGRPAIHDRQQHDGTHSFLARHGSGHFDRLAKQLGGSVGAVVTALERLSQAMAITEEDDQ
jgi:hypothetical protein